MDIRQKGNKYYRDTWVVRLIDFIKGGGGYYLVGIVIVILCWIFLGE